MRFAGVCSHVLMRFAGVCSHVLVSSAQAQATQPPTEAARAGEASPVATGNLAGIGHKTSGNALILRTAGGGAVLCLESFRTSNGPDVRVYLVKGNNAASSDFIRSGGGNFVDLGALKGNVGDQNYTIPANVILEEYKSVSIWCRCFAINFGAGTLEPTGQ
jgi:hypothetical protein